MKKCEGCGKRRLCLLTCPGCGGRFCIFGEVADTCVDRHEESGE